MDGWDDLRFFLAVARTGTLTGAAKQLGLDATTVGRRVAGFEERTRSTLFRRTRTGWNLTPAGQRLVPRAERIEAEVLASERELSGADEALEGPLRLTAGDGLSAVILAPALLSLRRENPRLRIELRADNRSLDLSRREADVAVRLFRPRERSLVVRRLETFHEGLYASPRYLEERGTPTAIADLAGHDWIGPSAELDGLPHFRQLRKEVPGLEFGLRSSSTMGQLAAAASGHGLVVAGTLLGERYPGLVRVLPRLELPKRDLWVVVHEDLKKNARVSRVIAWLVETFGTSGSTPRG